MTISGPTGTAGERTRRSCVIGAAAVFLFTAGLTSAFLVSNLDATWPFSIFYYGDTPHYHRYALSILHGRSYDHGIPYHPPAYAWFLAGVYKILGPPVRSGVPYKISTAGLVCIAAVLAWIWWFRVLGFHWAVLGIVLFAAHFGVLVFGASLNNEALYLVWLTLTLGWAWIGGPDFRWFTALGLGVLMAGGTLTRAEHAGLWPLVLFYLWMVRDRRLPSKTWALRAAAGTALFLLLLLPWEAAKHRDITAYNRTTPALEPLPAWVPVTSYGPLNFALANNDSADGGFRPDLITRLGGRGRIDLGDPAQRRIYIHGYALGLRWLWDHPGKATRLMLAKVNRWLDGFRLGWGLSNWPGGLDGVRRPVDLFIPKRTGLKWILTLLLLAGAFLSCLLPYRPFLICSLALLHRFGITLLFFGYARGLVVMLPAAIPLLLLPGYAWARTVKKTGAAKTVLALAVTIALAAAIQAGLIAARPPRNYMASGSIDPATRKIIQDAEVRIWPKTD